MSTSEPITMVVTTTEEEDGVVNLATGTAISARRETIRGLLLERGAVRTSELAAEFGVSTMTVSRDLEAMESDGWLQRTRGGATVQRSALFELNVWARLRENTGAKREIAVAAAAIVKRGAAVFLDDSSTALACAERLGEQGPVTLITNFRKIQEQAISNSGVHLITLGGQYLPSNDSFQGEITVLSIEALSADIAFVSTSAIRGGSCYHQVPQSISVKRAMLRAAERTVLLVDHSKFAKRALHRFAAISDFDTVIVDSGIHEADLAALQDLGVEVIVAKPLGDEVDGHAETGDAASS